MNTMRTVKIQWNRPNEGVESKDGRFLIAPLYCGATRPAFWELWIDGRRIGGYFETQAEAKIEAQRWANAEVYGSP